LHCSKTTGWLPANCLKPTFTKDKEGPAGEHPLVRHGIREFIPEEENCGVVEELQPLPESAAKKRRAEWTCNKRLLDIQSGKTVEDKSTNMPCL
jgi:hypothetical protein